ncbi:MAG: hypothetical protein ACXW25_12900 [Rhodospirillales bacterium]
MTGAGTAMGVQWMEGAAVHTRLRRAALAALVAGAAVSVGLRSPHAEVTLTDDDLDAVSAGSAGSVSQAAAHAAALALGPGRTLAVTFTNTLVGEQEPAAFAVGSAEAFATGEALAAAVGSAQSTVFGAGTFAVAAVQAGSAATNGTAVSSGRAKPGATRRQRRLRHRPDRCGRRGSECRCDGEHQRRRQSPDDHQPASQPG